MSSPVTDLGLTDHGRAGLGLRSVTARVPVMVREHEVLRLVASLSGKDGHQSALTARREVLQWVEQRSGGKLPDAAWRGEKFSHLAGGRNSAAVRIAGADSDYWAIRADDPDKGVAQRIWTTEVTVAHQAGQRSLFGIRLLVSSPERDLPFEPAVPSIVRRVTEQCGLDHDGMKLQSPPWAIQSDADAETLIDFLVDPTRRVPAFVLTVPDQGGDPDACCFDVHGLARATLGLAITAIVPARFAWALTNRFGKRLSVYGGAVRAYLPGFSEEADPYGHRLFVAERTATRQAANAVGLWMRQLAASESLRRLRLGHEVLSFAAVRELRLDQRRGRLEQEGAADSEQLDAARDQIRALKEDLRKAVDAQQWLSDEHQAAEHRAIAAEATSIATTYRVHQLTLQLQDRGGTPDGQMSLPDSWSAFADWCEHNLHGRVQLSARARKEVKAPAFRDVEVAAKSLRWLANEYRERRLSGGDGDLRTHIGNGIQNDRCGADSFRVDWRGHRVEVEWHIKSGGNTRDPDRCLRIYYFWDEPSRQVVIASMPGHVATGAT